MLINLFSLIFYGAWNPFYLLLIFYSAAIDYYCALAIQNRRHQAGLFLLLSLVSNLTLLAFFKYFNFFSTALCDFSNLFNVPCQPQEIHLLLPIGISFYTFQTMAYTIDVYRKQLVATSNFNEYFCYVSFFPQLIAGPIERASHLLPQIRKIGSGEQTDGDWRLGGSLIIRGLIKKVVVADNLALFVDPVFASMESYDLLTIALATFFFAIQIYCDFSGYTDIARGLASAIGIRLMENFNYPYIAVNIRDFWRRWHISLSTWLRDYLYISMGGNQYGLRRTTLYLMITMLLGGLWHGASYNFILWGAYHGVLLTLNREGLIRLPFVLPNGLRWAGTMVLVLFGWFLFRLENIGDLTVLAWKIRTILWGGGITMIPSLLTLFAALFFIGITLWELKPTHGRIMPLMDRPVFGKPVLLGAIAALYYLAAPGMDRVFIYFQF
ncbi:MAG: MBOAT family protein [Magnetococcales bacterium]|nr:MBOAT family protein [Magnetococcales bacterium]